MVGALTDAPAPASSQSAIQDRVRSRELYKYFVPPNNTLCASLCSTPDTVLTAHAQLVAWRLHTQRAMISLIDRDIQYFVAESTKTLQLDDDQSYKDPNDCIWVGCTNVPKAGRLCEYTIQTTPSAEDGIACFEVLDLTQDNRFNQLPFVCSTPYFKYYCGVPLRTKKGINIGSLFVLDDKVRESINESARAFLSTMADNVMMHLEMMKEKEERKRAMNMNMCLAAFVDPEHQIRRRKRGFGAVRPSTSRSDQTITDPQLTASPGPDLPAKPSPSPRNHRRHLSAKSGNSAQNYREESEDSSTYESESGDKARVEEGDHLGTFQRAADLLREALSVDGGGGVVFLDTNSALRKRVGRSPGPSEESSDGGSEKDFLFRRRASVDNVTVNSTSSWDSRIPNGARNDRHATVEEPVDRLGDSVIGSAYVPLAPGDMKKLIKRHPRGRLFTFTEDEAFGSSSSGDDNDTRSAYHVPKRKDIPSRTEAVLLNKHFPGARQVIFLPLWDSTSSQWSACFAYNCSDFRTFSHNPDFLYCIAFCNCVMTEVSRLATLAADQLKSDFIGSISHELRSPLHGILASCEFLGDTECTSFQKSLVDTADSCARTLLDTINMVLDYSKINSFERNAGKAKKSKRDVAKATPGLQPHLNIYGDVDLAAITEEVVEGVATGQVFKDSLTGNDANDLHAHQTLNEPANRRRTSSHRLSALNKRAVSRANVEIILDISQRDWTFVTQPGAFRRVVMNLFGNALKYTREGFIKVKLEAKEDAKYTNGDGAEQKDGPITAVTLTVADSGQGISPEYMRTKLFTPFSQESALAPGTGLGLSLVKSIVDMLHGEINIKSSLDVGTEVTVTLPMSKGSPSSSNTSGSTPTSSGSSIERVKDDSLRIVQEQAHGRRVAIFWTQHKEGMLETMEPSEMVRDSLKRCLTGWLGFSEVTDWTSNSTADMIFTEEADFPALLDAVPELRRVSSAKMVILLCTTASRQATGNAYAGCGNVETLSHPYGPYKLAKAVRRCFERHGSSTLGGAEPNVLTTIPELSRQQSSVEAVVNAVEQITLAGADEGTPDISLLKQGSVLANEESSNALMAMDSFQQSASSSSTENKQEFPFPGDPTADGTVSPTTAPLAVPHRPPLELRRTISPTRKEIIAHEPVLATPMSSAGAATTSSPATAKSATRSPRLLLVDDNKVNLRLLQTFMKKRKYDTVTSAEDGLQAVSAFTALISQDPPQPPDIVFMDISMPVVNGFEATRRIRDIETEFRQQLPAMQTPAPSLIIALTGLASGRDQSEAFTSGFDLYMTKPVSFREVGRLLDNWEANGGAATEGVPHGPVTAENAPL